MLLCCLQVVTEYDDSQLPLVLEALERMSHHLTAAVVSNDINYVQHVLANSVNGTTYAGIRARTTGNRTLHPRPAYTQRNVDIVKQAMARPALHTVHSRERIIGCM